MGAPASGSTSPGYPDRPPVTLMLVDDHPSSRTPLAMLLNRQPDLRVTGEAGSVTEATGMIAGGFCPDVAIVDLDLGDGSGVDVIRALRASCGNTRSLVLTGLRDERARGEALYEGAAGAMLKSASTEEVIDAVRALAGGDVIAPGDAMRLMRAWIDQLKAEWRFERAVNTLTIRERDVLTALTDGLTDGEIATRCQMSVATVRSHVRAILGKLEVDSRLKAVVLTYRAGHVPPGP